MSRFDDIRNPYAPDYDSIVLASECVVCGTVHVIEVAWGQYDKRPRCSCSLDNVALGFGSRIEVLAIRGGR